KTPVTTSARTYTTLWDTIPGAAVSAPLDWSELGPDIGPAYFTIANMPARIDRLTSDPWADFRAKAAKLKFPKP
ncbi:MAG: hypothetical protein ABI832_23565, partial [bacterium]